MLSGPPEILAGWWGSQVCPRQGCFPPLERPLDGEGVQSCPSSCRVAGILWDLTFQHLHPGRFGSACPLHIPYEPLV